MINYLFYYIKFAGVLIVLYTTYTSYILVSRLSSLSTASFIGAPREDNCSLIIQDTLNLLSIANLSVSCSPLQLANCPAVYDEIHKKSDPFHLFLRSSTCDIDMPEFSGVDQFELNFPLAYFITAFKDSRNIELMLKTIFRPHNAYCIHVDPKADEMFRRTVQQILLCYQQKYPMSHIFRASRSVPVYWGDFSIVEAELICLQDLLALDLQWKYAINLAGSELMLLTNKELVRNLSYSEDPGIYVESYPMPEQHIFRVKSKFYRNPNIKFDPDHASMSTFREEKNADPVPFNLSIYKGCKSYRLPRNFVEFLLHHPVATTFVDWSKTTLIPDETIVPTLARISHMEEKDGQWTVEQDSNTEPHYHLQLWDRLGQCRGFWRNSVCVFSIRDLDTILQSGCYIVNKFRNDFHPYVTQCLTEIVQERSNKEL